jgi:hypothetical protein
MKDQFINSKIIGIIYKNLVSKLNLDLNNQEKTKLTKKIINVMSQVYTNIDSRRVNEQNFKNILRQFINNCYQIVYNDINKDGQQSYERFNQDNKMERDRQIMGDRRNMLDQRSFNRDDKFASFNDSFQINPRQQNFNGYSGRIDQDDYNGKKSEFAGSLEDRYAQLQDEYRNTFQMNKRPSTPPELKGDGGANLNRMARENLKNKQESQSSKFQNNSLGNSQNNTSMSSRNAPNQNSNMPKDTFNFGTVTDVDNNYDTIDGSKIDFEGNMNESLWNTGINPEKFNIDESVPLEKKLAQYQRDREILENDTNNDDQNTKKQVRFDQSPAPQQSSQQRQQQEQQRQQEQQKQQEQQRQQQQRQQEQMRQQQLRQQQIRQQQYEQEQYEQEQYEQQQRQQQRQPPPQQRQLQQRQPSQQPSQQIPLKQQQQQLQQQVQKLSNKRHELMEQDNVTPDMESKIDEYENMIGLLLEKIKDLQKQQIRFIGQEEPTEDEVSTKLRLLDDKKSEIMTHVSKLQQMTLNL